MIAASSCPELAAFRLSEMRMKMKFLFMRHYLPNSKGELPDETDKISKSECGQLEFGAASSACGEPLHTT